MKKLKALKLAFIFLMGASLFFSCKSAPDLNYVDPFELIGGDNSLYITVPVQANAEFVSSAVSSLAKVSLSDAEKVAEKLDTAYIGVKRGGEIQLSASGSIPTAFAALAFTEKKGWKTSVIDNQTVYENGLNSFQLCLPSSSNVFLSKNILPMINKFNDIAYAEIKETGEKESESFSSLIDPAAYNFLHGNSSPDILIYSPEPNFLISSLIGAELALPLVSLYGSLSQYRGVKDQFNVKLILNLTDPRTVRACTALLKTAMFGIPAKIEQTGLKQITISDLPLSQKSLLSFFR